MIRSLKPFASVASGDRPPYRWARTDEREFMADSTPATPDRQEGSTQKLSTLTRFFNEEAQHRLVEDDRIAWRNVCGLLFTIVFFGVLLGFLGVLLSMQY